MAYLTTNRGACNFIYPMQINSDMHDPDGHTHPNKYH